MPTLKINGTELAYTDTGTGPALLLLHGFPLDRRIFDELLPILSKKNRVITLDQRGFGQSKASEFSSLTQLADDAHEVIKQLKLEKPVLGGLSMGGYVAQAFVKKYPNDLKGLILFDTKSESDDEKGKEGRNKMIESAKTGGAKAVAEQMLPKMLAPQTPEKNPSLKESVKKIMEACPVATIVSALTAMRDRVDFRPMLPSIKFPVLLVFGKDDQISPLKIGESIKAALPNATLEAIPDAGHLSTMEQPKLVAEAVAKFLERVQ